MAAIKKVFGPVNTKRQHDRIKWSFTGIRENGQVCRWTLTFYAEFRAFRAKSVPPKPGDRRLSEPGLFPAYEATEPITGLITSLLKDQLKPEHIAETARLALKITGRR